MDVRRFFIKKFAVSEIIHFSQSRRELYSEHPNFNKTDIDAAIKNFQYAYGYFSSNCPLKD